MVILLTFDLRLLLLDEATPCYMGVVGVYLVISGCPGIQLEY